MNWYLFSVILMAFIAVYCGGLLWVAWK